MIGSVVIAIFLLSIGASFVQRTTGFGFGIVMMKTLTKPLTLTLMTVNVLHITT